MTKLRYKFKNDGTFWMSFQDVLENFDWIYRTRLFDEHWMTTQRWISTSVPWLGGQSKKTFVINVQHKDNVVIVLSQVCTLNL